MKTAGFDPQKYFDGAATTPLDERVRDEMVANMHIWGNDNSKHLCGFEARKSIDSSLARIAKVLKVSPDQIFPTYSGTDASRRIIWEGRKRFGEKALFASVFEHSSVADEIAQKFDPDSEMTEISDPAFIAQMHANSETGRIFDLQKIAKKFPRAFLFADSCQSFPKNIWPDFEHADAISFAPQKFYGPKFCGLIWLRNPELFPQISKDAHTKNAFLIAGMAKSFEIWDAEREQTEEKMQKWQHEIESFVATKFAASEFHVHEADRARVAGVSNIAFRGVRGAALAAALSENEQICVSTGSACTSDLLTVTPTISEIQQNPDFQFPIRISLHKFLTDGAVADFCEILEFYVRELFKKSR